MPCSASSGTVSALSRLTWRSRAARVAVALEPEVGHQPRLRAWAVCGTLCACSGVAPRPRRGHGRIVSGMPICSRAGAALIFGVANRRSIAWAIAQALAREGAELAFTFQGERIEQGVRDLAATVDSAAGAAVRRDPRERPGRGLRRRGVDLGRAGHPGPQRRLRPAADVRAAVRGHHARGIFRPRWTSARIR